MTDKETIHAVCTSTPKFTYNELPGGVHEFYIGKLKIADVFESSGDSPLYDYKIVLTGISKHAITIGQGQKANESKREVHRTLTQRWIDFMLEIYTDTFPNK